MKSFLHLILVILHNILQKKNLLNLFDKFKIREKLLQCYILFLIIMHNNLENKKNVVKILYLAHTLKI